MEPGQDTGSAPIYIPEDDPDAEALRRAHIRAENDMRAIGALTLAAVALQAFVMLGSFEPWSVHNVMAVMVLTVAGLSGVLLRKLEPAGRWLFTMMTVMGLPGVVFGAPAMIDLIMGPDVWFKLALPFPYLAVAVWGIKAIVPPLLVVVLWSRRWRKVTSKNYRDVVIPATPHIEDHRNSPQMLAAVALPLISFLAYGLTMEIMVSR